MRKQAIDKATLIEEMRYSAQRKHSFQYFIKRMRGDWDLNQWDKPELLLKVYSCLLEIVEERKTKYNQVA